MNSRYITHALGLTLHRCDDEIMRWLTMSEGENQRVSELTHTIMELLHASKHSRILWTLPADHIHLQYALHCGANSVIRTVRKCGNGIAYTCGDWGDHAYGVGILMPDAMVTVTCTVALTVTH